MRELCFVVRRPQNRTGNKTHSTPRKTHSPRPSSARCVLLSTATALQAVVAAQQRLKLTIKTKIERLRRYQKEEESALARTRKQYNAANCHLGLYLTMPRCMCQKTEKSKFGLCCAASRARARYDLLVKVQTDVNSIQSRLDEAHGARGCDRIACKRWEGGWPAGGRAGGWVGGCDSLRAACLA